MTGYILRHEAHFRAVMEEQLRLESSEQIRIRRKRLERNENSIAELKRLFIRIYEDNACGRLSDERFDITSRKSSSILSCLKMRMHGKRRCCWTPL